MIKRPTLADIQAAQSRLAPYIKHTPVLRAEKMDEHLGCAVHLKAEMFQVTGSFKARGAFNKILLLSPEERERGMIASSSGNHAQALAYASNILGGKAIAVMPHTAPFAKVARAEALGAEVILLDAPQTDRWTFVDKQIAEKGYTMVAASDDPNGMAGAGTIAIEILEELPNVTTIVVPVGGGGLVSGVATYVKERGLDVRIVGVEAAQAPKFHESRKNGKPTVVPAGATIADGIRAEIPGKNAYPVIEQYVDGLVLVEDSFIIEALRMLAQDAKLFAEGAAAAAIGAALAGKIRFAPSEKVCFIVSGGNWDIDKFATVCGLKERA